MSEPHADEGAAGLPAEGEPPAGEPPAGEPPAGEPAAAEQDPAGELAAVDSAAAEQGARPEAPRSSAGPAYVIAGILSALLLGVAVPLGVAAFMVQRLFAGDGDIVRELKDFDLIDLDSPQSAVTSTIMYSGALSEPLEFGSRDGAVELLCLRFPIELRPGSRLDHADIVMRCDNNLEGSGQAATGAIIEVLDTDDQPPFTETRYPRPEELLHLKTMEGAINWDVDPWQGGEPHATPDLKRLIEAFVARPGYRPGSYIGIRIRGSGKVPQTAHDRSYCRAISSIGSAAAPYLRLVLAEDRKN